MPGTTPAPAPPTGGALGDGAGPPVDPLADGDGDGLLDADPDGLPDGLALLDGDAVADGVGLAVSPGGSGTVGKRSTGVPFSAALVYAVQIAAGNEPPLTRPPPPAPDSDSRVRPSAPVRNSTTAVDICGV
jgi:hypothetical protein